MKGFALFILIVTLFIFSPSVYAQWIPYDTGTGKTLMKLCPISGQGAMLSGKDTLLMKTTDGGASWTQVQLTLPQKIPYDFMDIAFSDQLNGYVAGTKAKDLSGTYQNGTMLHTTDGGDTWTPVPLSAFSDGSSNITTDPMAGEKANFSSVVALNNDTIFTSLSWSDPATGTTYGYIFRSTDAGASWQITSPDFGRSTINRIAFNASRGYAIGSLGAFLTTTNRGDSWNDLSNSSLGSLNDIIPALGDTAVIAGQYGVSTTVDGGTTIVPSDSIIYAFDAFVLDDTTFLSIGGRDTKTARTIDKGKTWQSANIGQTTTLFHLDEFAGKVWALGSNGIMEHIGPNEILDPKADFTYTQTDNEYTFTNQAENFGTLTWDFGDGVVMDGIDPTHAYPAFGAYDVTLTATNAVASVTSVAQTVAVNNITSLWTQVPINSDTHLAKLVQLNNRSAVLLGLKGEIFRSTDGGLTWPKVAVSDTLSSYVPMDMKFEADSTHGYISFYFGGNNNFIISTADSGKTWSPLPLTNFSDGSGNYLTDLAAGANVKFMPLATVGDTVYTAARWSNPADSKEYHGFIFKSTDHGTTWTKTSDDLYNGYTSYLFAMEFSADGKTGYIGGNRTIWKTSDYGKTWTMTANANLGAISDILLINPDTVYMSSSAGMVASTDGMATYNLLSTSVMTDMIRVGDSTLIAGKINQMIQTSSDWGTTWQSADTGRPAYFYELANFGDKVFILSNSALYFSLQDNFLRPKAGFEMLADGKQVTFTNTSTNALTYEWDFGDQSTSTEVDPIHDYAYDGTYQVSLVASNRTARDTIQVDNVIIDTAVDSRLADQMNVYPNPSSDGRFVLTLGTSDKTYEVSVMNLTGATILKKEVPSGKNNLAVSLGNKPAGIYLLRVNDHVGHPKVFKLIRR